MKNENDRQCCQWQWFWMAIYDNDHEWCPLQWLWTAYITVQWSWLAHMTMIMNSVHDNKYERPSVTMIMNVVHDDDHEHHQWICLNRIHDNGGKGYAEKSAFMSVSVLSSWILTWTPPAWCRAQWRGRQCWSRRPGYHTPPDTVRTSYFTDGGVGSVGAGDRVTTHRLTQSEQVILLMAG